MRYASNDVGMFDLYFAEVRETRADGPDIRWRLEDARVSAECPANPHGAVMSVPEMWLTLVNPEIRAATETAHVDMRPIPPFITEYPARDVPREEWRRLLLGTRMLYAASERAPLDGRRALTLSVLSRKGMDIELLADDVRFEWDDYAGPADFTAKDGWHVPDSE